MVQGKHVGDFMDLIASYQNKFYRNDYKHVFSPYRICPLGAHVDHQHGLVTGMTLDHGIDFIYGKRQDRYVKIQSADFPDEEFFDMNNVPAYVPGSWGNYIRGAVIALSENYKLTKGIEGIAHGSLPIGGLSSSAAVCSAYLLALAEANNINLSKLELIDLARHVENHFIGLNNGILDQASNLLSENHKLLFMDTKTEEYQLVDKPSSMPEFEVVVVYSGISKSLVSTDYNNRVDECKAAAWYMQAMTTSNIDSFKSIRLRDISMKTFREVGLFLPNRFYKRAHHFYYENERVERGVEAWKSGDLDTFGRLMFESGESSIHFYESGCPELIDLYRIMKKAPGMYGARFSGAGYRGCCIGLVNPKFKSEIKHIIENEYLKLYPQFSNIFRIDFCKTDDGARIL